MIRKDIRSLNAYHVQDSDGMVKLDAMENPYVLPEGLRKAWLEHLAGVDVNRYPDADMLALREKIAALDGVRPEQILIGNGSDEIIQMILMAVDPGTCITPEPTFVMFGLMSRWLKRPMATTPLNKDFSLDPMQFLTIGAREKAEVAFLACPNNPTGNMWSREALEKIVSSFRGMIVIDEAYRPFATRTHVDLIDPHVLILRTFSKLGWAGLRLGYAIGDADVIEDLNKVRLPYNINSLSQASAMFFMDNYEVFEEQAKLICRERFRVSAALTAMDGVEVFPSEANFLLLRVADADAAFKGLLERKILIKKLHGQHALLDQCLRVTIGTPVENDLFLNALKEVLA